MQWLKDYRSIKIFQKNRQKICQKIRQKIRQKIQNRIVYQLVTGAFYSSNTLEQLSKVTFGTNNWDVANLHEQVRKRFHF